MVAILVKTRILVDFVTNLSIGNLMKVGVLAWRDISKRMIIVKIALHFVYVASQPNCAKLVILKPIEYLILKEFVFVKEDMY